MNWHLFSAFLVIAIVLFLTPGPIVTLVVTTGARSGVRAALTTVAGGVTGNALLLACIDFGLNWILQTSAEIFDFLRWIGAAYLVWLGIMAWRHAGAPDKAIWSAWPCPRVARFGWGANQPEDHRLFHGFPAAVHRPDPAG